jgi:predicted ATP-grasp superfamily ATP-dependent carboligase
MVDSARGPAAGSGMAEFRLLASSQFHALAAAVRDLIGNDDIAVIADSDRWLRFVQSHRDALAAQRWHVLHPSVEALEICLNKSAFLQWCASHSLAAPVLHDPASLNPDDLSLYPVLLRPERTRHDGSSGLPKAIQARNPEELKYWLERYGQAGVQPNVCQSLLRAGLRQYSVGAARDRAGRVLTFLAEKVRPEAERCAGGTFVAPAQRDGVEELAARALHALAFFGVAEVEVLFDEQTRRGYLVEINARPWLQHGLPYVCGVDLLGHALGQPVHRPARDRSSHAWLYFGSDLYACFSRSTGVVTKGKLSVWGYLRSLLRADVYALWDWRDPRPSLQSFLQSLRQLFSAPAANAAQRPPDPE